MQSIVRCISCEGFGWIDDDFSGETEECDWCAGIGYVYRGSDQVDRRIPAVDWKRSDVSARLEELETERLRQMGYSGDAKKPWQQEVRKDTQGGVNPYGDA